MSEQNLHSVIEQTVELGASRAAAKALSLTCQIRGDCRSATAFDAWCMRQLLTNLLSNAIEYTHAGSVTVDASAEARGDEIAYVIEVSDTGPGIADDIAGIVFLQPEQREQLEHQHDVGFGLVISRQLATRMGATLALEALPEGGTRAVVSGRMSAAGETDEPLREVADVLRDTRALVVDSDVVARRLLEAHLRSWGIDVFAVLNIDAAIDAVRAVDEDDAGYSMLFVSHEMDGHELEQLLGLLQQSVAHRDTMLVVTGDELSTGRFAVLENSTDSVVLQTPLRASELFDCIAQHPRVRSRAEAPTAALAADDGQLPTRRVLLVEDNVVNQCVASEILKRIGVSVEIANNGAEALKALDTQRFDFVFMDCQMPEIDGFEATRRVRAQSRFEHLPIVALTANALAGDREACLAAGMNDYLTKPFTRDQLEQMLDKWTGQQPAAASPSATSASAVRLIDQATLDEIRMLDETGESVIFDEIVGEYLKSSARLVDALARAVGERNASDVAHHAHSLKSASAALGLAEFSNLCARLEHLGRGGRAEDAAALWPSAQKCYGDSVSQLSRLQAAKVA